MTTLTETQLIELLEPDLPILAYPARNLSGTLRGKFPELKITIGTLLEIIKVHDMGEAGGVCCGIVPVGFDKKKMKEAIVCSITHLVIKRGEPHYAEVFRYQTKRVKKLEKMNRRF